MIYMTRTNRLLEKKIGALRTDLAVKEKERVLVIPIERTF